ncbi:hypothetical protein BESB_061770 [Besnoitia besnoiti]|uniref:GPI ethanolamine phosphate transferase 2 C-terminal domain-containing protein n=1 Tax=Besnoitia besnoiti TaxID=94643 RepID=A0A2A9MIQ7_BESBE|nr:hypothetical protein BESB_061770 [Besnoitia besnoiti]PFH35290.1 hypothetical protein BESB_061770 [Besnoitia besnoiti]
MAAIPQFSRYPSPPALPALWLPLLLLCGVGALLSGATFFFLKGFFLSRIQLEQFSSPEVLPFPPLFAHLHPAHAPAERPDAERASWETPRQEEENPQRTPNAHTPSRNASSSSSSLSSSSSSSPGSASSGSSGWVSVYPYEHLVLLLVDALRFDFAFWDPGKKPPTLPPRLEASPRFSLSPANPDLHTKGAQHGPSSSSASSFSSLAEPQSSSSAAWAVPRDLRFFSRFFGESSLPAGVGGEDGKNAEGVEAAEGAEAAEAPAHHNNMEALHFLLSHDRKLDSRSPFSSRLFVFEADAPTATTQRLKALASGTLPTFFEVCVGPKVFRKAQRAPSSRAGIACILRASTRREHTFDLSASALGSPFRETQKNSAVSIEVRESFASSRVTEDNLLLQLRNQRRASVALGDDTWESLFGHLLTETRCFPSFDIHDIHTVDDGVLRHLGTYLPVHHTLGRPAQALKSANTEKRRRRLHLFLLPLHLPLLPFLLPLLLRPLLRLLLRPLLRLLLRPLLRLLLASSSSSSPPSSSSSSPPSSSSSSPPSSSSSSPPSSSSSSPPSSSSSSPPSSSSSSPPSSSSSSPPSSSSSSPPSSSSSSPPSSSSSSPPSSSSSSPPSSSSSSPPSSSSSSPPSSSSSSPPSSSSSSPPSSSSSSPPSSSSSSPPSSSSSALSSARSPWSFVAAHFLGVDHVGHKAEVRSPLMSAKLRQMDRVLLNVSAHLLQAQRAAAAASSERGGGADAESTVSSSQSLSAADRTLVMMIGDHGMTDDGAHGGPLSEEVDAALFAFSLLPFSFSSADVESLLGASLPLFASPAPRYMRHHSGFAPDSPPSSASPPSSPPSSSSSSSPSPSASSPSSRSSYSVSSSPIWPRRIRQVDWTSTVALLLGLPIPFSSLGALIPDIVPSLSSFVPACAAAATMPSPSPPPSSALAFRCSDLLYVAQLHHVVAWAQRRAIDAYAEAAGCASVVEAQDVRRAWQRLAVLFDRLQALVARLPQAFRARLSMTPAEDAEAAASQRASEDEEDGLAADEKKGAETATPPREPSSPLSPNEGCPTLSSSSAPPSAGDFASLEALLEEIASVAASYTAACAAFSRAVFAASKLQFSTFDEASIFLGVALCAGAVLLLLALMRLAPRRRSCAEAEVARPSARLTPPALGETAPLGGARFHSPAEQAGEAACAAEPPKSAATCDFNADTDTEEKETQEGDSTPEEAQTASLPPAARPQALRRQEFGGASPVIRAEPQFFSPTGPFTICFILSRKAADAFGSFAVGPLLAIFLFSDCYCMREHAAVRFLLCLSVLFVFASLCFLAQTHAGERVGERRRRAACERETAKRRNSVSQKGAASAKGQADEARSEVADANQARNLRGAAESRHAHDAEKDAEIEEAERWAERKEERKATRAALVRALLLLVLLRTDALCDPVEALPGEQAAPVILDSPLLSSFLLFLVFAFLAPPRLRTPCDNSAASPCGRPPYSSTRPSSSSFLSSLAFGARGTPAASAAGFPRASTSCFRRRVARVLESPFALPAVLRDVLLPWGLYAQYALLSMYFVAQLLVASAQFTPPSLSPSPAAAAPSLLSSLSSAVSHAFYFSELPFFLSSTHLLPKVLSPVFAIPALVVSLFRCTYTALEAGATWLGVAGGLATGSAGVSLLDRALSGGLDLGRLAFTAEGNLRLLYALHAGPCLESLQPTAQTLLLVLPRCVFFLSLFTSVFAIAGALSAVGAASVRGGNETGNKRKRGAFEVGECGCPACAAAQLASAVVVGCTYTLICALLPAFVALLGNSRMFPLFLALAEAALLLDLLVTDFRPVPPKRARVSGEAAPPLSISFSPSSPFSFAFLASSPPPSGDLSAPLLAGGQRSRAACAPSGASPASSPAASSSAASLVPEGLAAASLVLLAFHVFSLTGHRMTFNDIPVDAAFVGLSSFHATLSIVLTFLHVFFPFLLLPLLLALVLFLRTVPRLGSNVACSAPRGAHADSVERGGGGSAAGTCPESRGGERQTASRAAVSREDPAAEAPACAAAIERLFTPARVFVGVLVFAAVRHACSMLSLFALRRHLMVWSVFAPKFLYDIQGLFTVHLLFSLCVAFCIFIVRVCLHASHVEASARQARLAK